MLKFRGDVILRFKVFILNSKISIFRLKLSYLQQINIYFQT